MDRSTSLVLALLLTAALWGGSAQETTTTASSVTENARPSGDASQGLVPDPAERGHELIREGLVLLETGELEQAIAAFLEAQELIETTSDPESRGMAQLALAGTWMFLGEPDQALELYRGAQALFEEAGNLPALAAALMGEGLTRLFMARAALRLQESGEILANLEIREVLRRYSTNLDEAELRAGEDHCRQALEKYRSARILYEIAEDAAEQANAWLTEAEILNHQIFFMELCQLFGEMETLSETSPFEQDRVLEQLAEASAAIGLDEKRQALAAYRQARVFYQQLDDLANQGRSWLGEAKLLADLGREEQALTAYRQARICYAKTNHPQGQGITWQGEAEVHARAGNSGEAVRAYREARARFEQIGNSIAEAGTWLGEAAALLRRGESEPALTAYRHARNLYAGVDHLTGQGKSWLGEAAVLTGREDSAGAVEAYRQAIAIFERTGDRLGQLEAELGLSQLQSDVGEPYAGIHAGRNARALAAREADELFGMEVSVEKPLVYFHLGNIEPAMPGYRSPRLLWKDEPSSSGRLQSADALLRAGELERALEAYRRVRELSVSAGDGSEEARTLVGEGDALLGLGESERALRAYRAARRLFEALGDRRGQATVSLGIAHAVFHTVKDEGTLRAFRNVQALIESLGVREEQEKTEPEDLTARLIRKVEEGEVSILDLANRDENAPPNNYQLAIAVLGTPGIRGEGETSVLLGSPERVSKAYRNAQAWLEYLAPSLFGQGNDLGGEEAFFALVKRTQQALESYREARIFFRQVSDPLGQGASWIGEGDVLLLLGENRQALDAYRKANRLFKSGGSRLGEASSLLGKSNALREQWDWPGAAAAAATAAEIFQEASSTIGQLSAHSLEAFARERMGEWDAARKAARKAVKLYERRRQDRLFDRHRIAEDVAVAAAYASLVRAELRQRRFSAALALVEGARSRTLLDALAIGAGPVADAKSEPRREGERIAGELARIEKELAGTSDPGRREVLRDQQRRLEQDLLWNRYELTAARADSPAREKSLDVPSIKALANTADPLLIYYSTVSEVVGFLVVPGYDEPVVRRMPLPQGELGTLIRLLGSHLANSQPEQQEPDLARILWEQLIAPFTGRLSAGGALHLIPHGPLHELPFAALVDSDGVPLFERWDLSVSPSASTLAVCRRHHARSRSEDVLGILSAGPFLSTQESIASFFGASRTIAARFPSYRQEAPGYRHLLISTRGVAGETSRSEPYLELIAGESHDSRLRASEIAVVGLRAELVTLAACDTAAGRALLSDDRLDLARAYLTAGAASVLAARWRIPANDRTARFLLDFYRAYRTGGPDGKGLRKDEALTVARRLSRERGDPPQVWAAWVLVGDPR